MRKSLICCLIAALMFALLVTPSFAWFYNEYPEATAPPEDYKFEMFGPRCDRLLIKLYETAEAEWDALKASPQELDVTDWPLRADYWEQFTTDPPDGYADKVNVESVGGEFGIRNLDMNQNPNPYLGIPPNPKYPNPVKNLNDTDPKNNNNPTSDVNFRRAILSCIDRTYYVSNIIGAGFAIEHWAMLPPATGLQYYQETFKMYPFSTANAISYLEAGGFKVSDITPPWRYWDIDGDNHEDDDEYVELKFVIRNDDIHRREAGKHLADQLESVGIRVNRMFMDISGARTQWMENKDAHLYTAGWSLGIEPDSIVLWMGDAGLPHNPDGTSDYSYYWHPGRCYNTAYANDAEFNVAARHVEIANSEAEAVTNMQICNQRAAEMALNGPMFVYSSTMANARRYVGGTPEETAYVGKYWDGMVMVTGYGDDSFFGFLNMHPRGYPMPEYGTIRYGFKTKDIRTFNPIYAEWVWDNNVLDLLYDTLIASNPYSLLTRLPWMCKTYTVGSYVHPTLGPCTKVVFTLRDDLHWTDNYPITTADVYFTLVELTRILRSRGYANPWWYSAVKSILSFSILDPLNFEVLINVKSIWAFGLTGAGVRILPEHIWRPIVESGDPTAIAPDPNMINSGPWRFRDYEYAGYVDLVANKPGRTVQTDRPGSVPITSTYGYFRWYPKYVDIHADGYRSKIIPPEPVYCQDQKWVLVNLTVTDHNLLQGYFGFEYTTLTPPYTGQNIYFMWPEPLGCEWTILEWVDQNPTGLLDPCDMLHIQPTNPPGPGTIWVHIQNVNETTHMLWVGQVLEADKWVWVVDKDGNLEYSLAEGEHEYEKPCVPIIEEFTVNLSKCRHTAYVSKHITTEWLLTEENTLVPNPWYCKWVNASWPIWVTIPEDVAGPTGTYYKNPNLVCPDCRVDMSDIYDAAKAFGSNPGHPRWKTHVDINGDYRADMGDIYEMCKKFGKW